MQWCPAGLSHRRTMEKRWEPGTWRATEYDSPATTATNCRGLLCACACRVASGPERRRNAWFPVWINLKSRSRLLIDSTNSHMSVSDHSINWIPFKSLGWKIIFLFLLFKSSRHSIKKKKKERFLLLNDHKKPCKISCLTFLQPIMKIFNPFFCHVRRGSNSGKLNFSVRCVTEKVCKKKKMKKEKEMISYPLTTPASAFHSHASEPQALRDLLHNMGAISAQLRSADKLADPIRAPQQTSHVTQGAFARDSSVQLQQRMCWFEVSFCYVKFLISACNCVHECLLSLP